MQHLLYEQAAITEKGGFETAREIEGQPALWQEVYWQLLQEKTAISQFLHPLLSGPSARIILTGAGSSAFIGEAAQGLVQVNTKIITHAIATTELVTHPHLHFMMEVPTLLVSFARSGNSPESMAAVELANEYCHSVYHLVITCNKAGALAQSHLNNSYHFILPEKANDKSLAMTGSFTAMLLSIVLISKIDHIESCQPALDHLVSTASELLDTHLKEIKALAEQPYERVIFLGSGPLLGIARECHLKLQELTDGKIICKHDSFLGFRHGPRAVVNEASLVVYLFSCNNHVLLYERDLALSMDADPRNIPTMSYGNHISALRHSALSVAFNETGENAKELLFIGAALTGQLFGFFHCLYLGLSPDNPSVSGSINRVVEGVVIYNEPVILH
jgi:tagatose-6-phosphate ketose/aldose isomerase